MAPSSDLGEFVWVKGEKLDHPAFLVPSEPPIIKDGKRCLYVKWQLQETYEFVEEDDIIREIGARQRTRVVPLQPRMTGRDYDSVMPPTEVKSSASAKTATKTTAPKQKVAKKPPPAKECAPSQANECAPLPAEDTAPSPVASCAPNPWAARWVREANEAKRLQDRPLREGDTVDICNELYVATGFSCFSNRFGHYPDLVEVKHHLNGDQDRRYLFAETCKLDPQEGQVHPAGRLGGQVSNNNVDDEEEMVLSPVRSSEVRVERNVANVACAAPEAAVNNTAAATGDSQGRAAASNATKEIPMYPDACQECPPGTVRPGRPACEGDIVYHEGEAYISTGFCSFYNRFEDVPDQLEFISASRHERVYLPAEICELNPRAGPIDRDLE